MDGEQATSTAADAELNRRRSLRNSRLWSVRLHETNNHKQADKPVAPQIDRGDNLREPERITNKDTNR